MELRGTFIIECGYVMTGDHMHSDDWSHFFVCWNGKTVAHIVWAKFSLLLVAGCDSWRLFFYLLFWGCSVCYPPKWLEEDICVELKWFYCSDEWLLIDFNLVFVVVWLRHGLPNESVELVVHLLSEIGWFEIQGYCILRWFVTFEVEFFGGFWAQERIY